MSAVIPFTLERIAVSTTATATLVLEHLDQLKRHNELLERHNMLLERHNEVLERLASRLPAG